MLRLKPEDVEVPIVLRPLLGRVYTVPLPLLYAPLVLLRTVVEALPEDLADERVPTTRLFVDVEAPLRTPDALLLTPEAELLRLTEVPVLPEAILRVEEPYPDLREPPPRDLRVV